MADILLSVGMQTGSAETKEFISQLSGIVNGLNSAESVKAKVGVQIDPASISDIRSKLSEISDFMRVSLSSIKIDNTGLSDFTTQLQQMRDAIQSMSGRNGIYTEVAKENALDAYRASAQKAVSDLRNAQEAITKINNEIAKSGGNAPRSYLDANSSFLREYINVASKLGDIENRIKSGSRSTISAEVTKITSAIESYNNLLTKLSESKRQEYGLAPIPLPKYDLGSFAQSAEETANKVAQAAEKRTAAEEQAAAKAEQAAEKEAQAAAKRAAAEEQAAEKEARAAAKRAAANDAQKAAYKDAERAVNEYYKLLSQLNSTEEARSDLTLGKNGWESLSGKNEPLAAQLNAATTAFNMLTSAESRSGMSAQQQVALQELMASKAREYARASEETANKVAQAAEKRAAAEEQAAAKAEQAAKRQKQTEENKRLTLMKSAQDQINAIEQLQRRLNPSSGLYQQLENLKGNYKSVLDELGNAKGAEKLGDTLAKTETRVKSLGLTFSNLKGQVGLAFGRIQVFGGGLDMLYNRINYFLSMSNMIIQAVRSIKKMVQTTVELDTSLTQLQVVTGESNDTMHQYGINAARTAQEIGGSTKDLIDSATVFARLGYTLDESSMLSKYTNMLQNVGAIDASTAQNAITAIVKAFNIDVSQIENVMDKMVTVGNNFPISVSEIAEGMNNAGSALHAAGNEFEQSVALLTAANTTVQNISKSSTGLRTIAARIRKTTVELDDLGETIEEAKYQDVIDLLTGKGVRLTENGEYRSTYDILKDIAGIWDQLSSMERAGVAEQLAGTRQQNIFYSIVEQFKEASDAMAAMENSSGALENAYSVFENSIQGHINSFKAAFDELSQTFVNSDFVKGVVDVGTVIINILTAITKALSGPVAGVLLGGGILGILGTGIAAGGGIKSLKDVFAAASLFIEALPGMLPWIGAAAAAIAGVVAVAGEIKTVKNAGFLGDGHTVQEYSDNVDAANARLKEAQENYDRLAASGADLTMADTELAHAKIAVAHATQEYNDALRKEQTERMNAARAAEHEEQAQALFEKRAEKLSEDTLKNLIDGTELTSEQMEELGRFMQETGYSAEEAATRFANMGAKMAEASEATRAQIGDLTSLNNELAVATKALEKYQKALEGGEKGDVAAKYTDAYKKAIADLEAGMTDTRAISAAAELLFSDEQLKAWGYDLERVGKELQNPMMKAIFGGEGGDPGKNFANYIKDNIKDFGSAAKIIENSDGSFDFMYTSVKDLAAASGLAEGTISALLDSLDRWGVQCMISGEEMGQLVNRFHELEDVGKSDREVLTEFVNELAASGRTKFEIQSIIKSMTDTGQINIDTTGLDDIISKANIIDSESPEITVDAKDNASSVINTIIDNLKKLPDGKTITITTIDATDATGETSGGGESSGGSSGKSYGGASRASGGIVKGGPTLVNELGPELISENGRAYIAGGGKPTVIDLDKNAIVIPAEETKKALSGSKRIGKPIGAAKAGLGLNNTKLVDDGGGKHTLRYLINHAVATIADEAAKAQKKNGGGGGGGGNAADDKDKQKIDWIAVAIDRVRRAVSRLEKAASSTFKKLDTRLTASRDAVKETTKEIGIMEAGYKRYLKEADSVGLDSGLAALVRDGTIDINAYDEETRKLIQEYQQWYEKALDCRDAIDDLHESIAKLYTDNFDNTQRDFENRLSQIEHSANMVEKNISMAEARGYLENAQFYAALSGNTSNRISTLKKELSGLQAQFAEAMSSGEIAEKSEAWYEMKDAIAGVEEELADANIELVEYANKMREINWSYFDYAQERIDQITEEAEFLLDLMSGNKLFEDNGQLSEYGMASLGMRVVNYETAMAKADEYAAELLRIEKEITRDPYNKELIARREDLLGLQQDSIQNAQAEKDAVKELVQEGIQQELSALQELIDAYNDSLDSAKDLYDYQKKIADQTANIASLEKQLAAYQNDTSQENRARVQKLQQQLRDARTNLQETERDKSVADQKKMLSELYSNYEEQLNHRLDDVDALMEDMIRVADVNRDEIMQTIESVSDRVGYSITDGMRTALMDSFSNYDGMFDHLTGIHTQLSNINQLVAAMAAASGATKAYASGGLIDYTGLAAVHGSPSSPELVLSAADTERFLEAAALLRSSPIAHGLSSHGLPGGGFGGTVINGLTISIPIDHVLDYNEMIAQMQRDPKFDRLINAITLDRVAGKSQLGKYGVRV